MPQNPALASAVQYTGRFCLKHRIQSRQFNAFHMDSHYGAGLQKYLKEFAVMYRDECALLSVDDKNHIPIGELGVPIATIYRSRKAVAHANVANIAADHDTASKCKLTPSACLMIDIPEDPKSDFYNGQVYVTLKDTIFEPSNPFRHIAEMRKILGTSGQLAKPIRLIYSDGGPDHRVTYPSVKLALIAMFLLDDCDYLLAMRTAPHQSFRNLVERIMSILNLALQTVAVQRSKMTVEMEHIMKSLNTMSAIRKAAEGNITFRESLLDSTKDVLQSLNSLFSRLTLKERNCITGEPASSTLIDELWAKLTELDPTVMKTDTQTKDINKRPQLKAFIDHCTLSRKYFFLIRKCGANGCNICKPPRLPNFENLKNFPDPVPRLDVPSKFMDFKDVYGKETTEEHCPSLKENFTDDDTLVCKCTAETIRDIIQCLDCNKPRAIYAAKKLTTEQKIHLETLKEECIYSCGGILVPEDHFLHGMVCVQMKITCQTPVSPHYYGTRCKFSAICFNCGDSEIVHIPEETKCFQTVHPVCKPCKDSGIQEKTRGNKTLSRKRKL